MCLFCPKSVLSHALCLCLFSPCFVWLSSFAHLFGSASFFLLSAFKLLLLLMLLCCSLRLGWLFLYCLSCFFVSSLFCLLWFSCFFCLFHRFWFDHFAFFLACLLFLGSWLFVLFVLFGLLCCSRFAFVFCMFSFTYVLFFASRVLCSISDCSYGCLFSFTWPGNYSKSNFRMKNKSNRNPAIRSVNHVFCDPKPSSQIKRCSSLGLKTWKPRSYTLLSWWIPESQI